MQHYFSGSKAGDNELAVVSSSGETFTDFLKVVFTTNNWWIKYKEHKILSSMQQLKLEQHLQEQKHLHWQMVTH